LTGRRSRRSPLHARGFARTMSASSLPATSEPTASKRAPASSTPRSRRGCDAPRFDTPIKEGAYLSPRETGRRRWVTSRQVLRRYRAADDRLVEHEIALLGLSSVICAYPYDCTGLPRFPTLRYWEQPRL